MPKAGRLVLIIKWLKKDEIKKWFLSSDKRIIGFVLLAMLFLIFATRTVAIRHEATLNPDEVTFYSSASSVFEKEGDYSFVSYKDYPNGAFIFQMPFQFIGKVISAKYNRFTGEREWGRVASIFYFSLACFMGGIILWRNFGKKPRAVFFYALIMVFSLMQIEQSRYGTGDTISFLLLMVILYALDVFLREGERFYLYFAAFFVGVLTAIKFPLVFFIMYPLGALSIKSRQAELKKSPLKPVIYICVFVLLGLLLFSPQWFVDKAFFMKTFFVELDAYVVGARTGDLDTPLNHFAYLLIYQLLYSDFPLALPLSIFGAVSLYRQNKKQAFTNTLYTFVLPVSLIIFFFYNLFAILLMIRTYYPYFCLCVFYTSYALSELFAKGKKWRIAVVALAALMVVRGGFFVYALTEKPRDQYIYDTLIGHEDWNNRKMMVVYDTRYITGNAEMPQRHYAYYRSDFLAGNPVLRPGEFGVTGGLEYGHTRINIFPATEGKERMRAGWVAFREQNKDYVIGVSYPPYYHYIFGGWLPGTTLALYEFPINYIYYRGREAGDETHNPQKYYPLYSKYEWRDWLESVAEIDCTVILSGNGALPADVAREVGALLSEDFTEALSSGEPFVVIIQPTQAEQRVIFSQNNEESIFLELTTIIGTPSSIDVSADSNAITVDERTYATRAANLNIVVYDRDMQCVMDWGSLAVDSENGEIVLNK
jgi:4-amino-4-deoxy-L-arabinose transferase-like glycosyltransferase